MAKKYPKLSSVLKKLLFDRDMKPVDLARAVDMPPPTIHRLVTGKSSRPYKTSLEPIAGYFSITVDQLLGEDSITIQEAENGQTSLMKNNVRAIPIITWKGTLALEEAITLGKKEIIVANDISEKSFALIMTDTSMEPLCPRGSILIFDPQLTPIDRSYVLVKLHDSKIPVFRQLLIDLEHKYLKPLNPDLSAFQMRILHKNDVILACLIESRVNHRPDEIEKLIGEIS